MDWFFLSALPPGGWYALPQTVYGCPRLNGRPWWSTLVEVRFTGHDLGTLRHESVVAAPVVGDVMTLSACISPTVATLREENQRPWPTGSYCVYQLGATCPQGRFC